MILEELQAFTDSQFVEKLASYATSWATVANHWAAIYKLVSDKTLLSETEDRSCARFLDGAFRE